MSNYEIELRRTFGKVEGDPVEVWVAECTNAEAYAEVRAKTPGDALRLLADEFDVQLGVFPRGNWSEHEDERVP